MGSRPLASRCVSWRVAPDLYPLPEATNYHLPIVCLLSLGPAPPRPVSWHLPTEDHVLAASLYLAGDTPIPLVGTADEVAAA
eukprot:9010599-Prorocentrum_lima.AAC.1